MPSIESSFAKIVVKVRGHVGNSTITTSGVRQGCPLSPTLFGVYIDALEGYLHDRVPLAGITLNTADGGTRLLASLIYADDIVLMDGDPDSLQRTLDSFAAFCTAYGLEISLNKIKIMQFLPTRCRGQPPPVRHAFALGSYDLETVDVYKYLGVSFCCSGNPADTCLWRFVISNTLLGASSSSMVAWLAATIFSCSSGSSTHM